MDECNDFWILFSFFLSLFSLTLFKILGLLHMNMQIHMQVFVGGTEGLHLLKRALEPTSYWLQLALYYLLKRFIWILKGTVKLFFEFVEQKNRILYSTTYL